MVDMLLARVVTYDQGEQHTIYLRERGGARGFPILIGAHEAAEIQRVVTGREPPRPSTHRLAHDTIGGLGAALTRVEITALRKGTFFAQLVIQPAGKAPAVLVDARPSDAIALALRAGCPIHVAAEVVAAAAGDAGPASPPSPSSGPSSGPGPSKPPPDEDPPPPKKRRKPGE